MEAVLLSPPPLYECLEIRGDKPVPSTSTQSIRKIETASKKRRNRRLVIAFFVFLGVVIFLESPLTRVRTTVVVGNKSIPEAKLVKESRIHSGMSLWQVNQLAVQSAITSKEPLVESVHVKTDYLHGVVTLSIKQKSVVAIFENGGHFYRLLSDGTVYDQVAPNAGAQWPIVTADNSASVAVGKRPDNPFVSGLCQELQKMSPSIENNISEFHIDSYGVLSMYLSDGFVAKCKVEDAPKILPSITEAIQYFAGKGYSPGTIDMTGQPPYRYTPFAQTTTVAQGGTQ